MRILFFASMAVALFASTLQAQILFEDFEDSTITYTPSVSDDLSDIAARDYFGRIASDTVALPADVSYSNLQGLGFYGVQDIDGTPSGNIDLITLDFFGLNITDYEDLGISFFYAEDDSGDGNEDWDTSTSFRASYQIDGGGFVDFFAIESEIGTDGNQTNEAPRIDTDFDTVGDGAEVTDAFTLFTQSLMATGTTLDLRFSFEDIDTGDEDLALDSVAVTGNFVGVAVPEPSAGILCVAMGGLFFTRRRRR